MSGIFACTILRDFWGKSDAVGKWWKNVNFWQKNHFFCLFSLNNAKRAFFFLCFHELHWTSLIYSPSGVKTQIFSNETNLKKISFPDSMTKWFISNCKVFSIIVEKGSLSLKKIFKNRTCKNARHLSFRDFFQNLIIFITSRVTLSSNVANEMNHTVDVGFFYNEIVLLWLENYSLNK